MKSKSAFLVIILCSWRLCCWQDEKQVQTDSSPRYLALGYHQGQDLEPGNLNWELERAAAAGYRVAYGDAAHNILVLEGVRRIPVSCAPELQERVQSGSGRRAFCAIPPTSSSDLYKPGMIIMEKPEDSSNVHDYLLLETVGTKTLQKELNEARGKAYELAAMSSDGCEERPHGEALPKTLRLAPDRWSLAATTRTSPC